MQAYLKILEGWAELNEILSALEQNPIIGALRDTDQIDELIKSSVGVVFILSGNLLNIKDISDNIRLSGKKVCIHVDLIEGLGKDHAAIDYMQKEIKPDGIITTKVSLAKYAKQIGLFTIQRLFIIDSQSLVTGIKNVNETMPDAVEVLPGIASKLIRRLRGKINVPVIAGGLVSTKEDIIDSLSEGAVAVSTSSRELWNM